MAGMAGAPAVGRRIGRRQRAEAHAGEEAVAGRGALDGVVFALLGLLMAFTFSSASTRFDERRLLIVSEANAIGTAYLRLDLLPAKAQPELRELFRRTTRSRLDTYRRLPDVEAAKASFEASLVLQSQIWARATKAAAAMPGPAPMLLLTPALNEMLGPDRLPPSLVDEKDQRPGLPPVPGSPPGPIFFRRHSQPFRRPCPFLLSCA